MKVAILGWGSLIWDSRSLQIDTAIGNAGWQNDGPLLSIEFARISNDGRLTLVIMPDSGNGIPTLYAISRFSNLDEAVLDLAIREGCGKNKIGIYVKNGERYSENFLSSKFKKSRSAISEWISDKPIDAVIWTNLSANHKEKLDLNELTPSDVVNYLKYLPADVQAKAEEYIRKTPSVVDTPIRREIESTLHWGKINL